MKKTLVFGLFGVFVAMLTGCSPKVVTDMYAYEYPPISKDSVMVVTPEDKVPEGSISIGNVEVSDPGNAADGTYEKVVGIAVSETAKNGGNILVLDIPNSEVITSSTNNVKGTIAYADIPVIDSLTLPSVIKRQVLWHKYASDSTIFQMHQRASKPTQFGGSYKLSAGPIETTSKMYLSSGWGKDYVTALHGYEVGFSINTMNGKYYGWGLDLYYNYTKMKLPSGYYSYSKDLPGYSILYLGPNFSLGTELIDRVRIELNLGVGLSAYNDDGRTEFGLGSRSSLGLDFRIYQNIGLGFEFFGQRTLFFKGKMPNGEANGIQQIGAMIGLRIYH